MDTDNDTKDKVAIATVNLTSWPFFARCRFLVASILALLGFEAKIVLVTSTIIKIEDMNKFVKNVKDTK